MIRFANIHKAQSTILDIPLSTSQFILCIHHIHYLIWSFQPSEGNDLHLNYMDLRSSINDLLTGSGSLPINLLLYYYENGEWEKEDKKTIFCVTTPRLWNLVFSQFFTFYMSQHWLLFCPWEISPFGVNSTHSFMTGWGKLSGIWENFNPIFQKDNSNTH